MTESTSSAARDPHQGPAPYRTFVTQVVRTKRLTRRLVRITFGGGDLVHFQSISPDQFVYLLLPPLGRDQLTIDASFTWDQFRQLPEPERPVGAYYTVRYFRPEAAELDIDVYLHREHGAASAWASRALPGAPAALWGPRMAYRPRLDTAWRLLIGDETGLPAIGAILESLPPGARAHALIEVSDELDEQPLCTAGDVEIVWLHRGAAEPGTTSLLVGAVRGLEFPDRRVYVWGGGEIRAINALRRHLREERQLDHDAVSLLTYWRHRDHAGERHEG